MVRGKQELGWGGKREHCNSAGNEKNRYDLKASANEIYVVLTPFKILELSLED